MLIDFVSLIYFDIEASPKTKIYINNQEYKINNRGYLRLKSNIENDITSIQLIQATSSLINYQYSIILKEYSSGGVLN